MLLGDNSRPTGRSPPEYVVAYVRLNHKDDVSALTRWAKVRDYRNIYLQAHYGRVDHDSTYRRLFHKAYNAVSASKAPRGGGGRASGRPRGPPPLDRWVTDERRGSWREQAAAKSSGIPPPGLGQGWT